MTARRPVVPNPSAWSGHAVVEVDLRRVRLPLVTAHHASHGSVEIRETIVVRVAIEQGSVGWGECVALAHPSYTSEYLDGCWAMLTGRLAPAQLQGGIDGVIGHQMAIAAIETAVLDAWLRASGEAMSQHLVSAGTAAESVPSVAVVGIASSIDELLAQVAVRVGAGHRWVKLKIRPGWDAEPLRAVRAAWPSLHLAADANGSYRQADAAIAVLRDEARVGDLGLEYLEQPLPADDLVGTAQLRARLGVPIALDESICSLGDLSAAVALGAIDVLNLKPARVGGMQAAAELADLARNVIPNARAVFCGGMLETGIGRAAALAVAALPSCTLPTDLGPSSSYFARDLTPPFELDGEGRLTVPTSPGIGVDPDLALLDEVTIERWHAARR